MLAHSDATRKTAQPAAIVPQLMMGSESPDPWLTDGCTLALARSGRSLRLSAAPGLVLPEGWENAAEAGLDRLLPLRDVWETTSGMLPLQFFSSCAAEMP